MLPDVILNNLNTNFTGVTATLVNLYPFQRKLVSVGLYGSPIHCNEKKVSLSEILRFGRRPPSNLPFRIWHARRTNELWMGILLRDLYRMKIKVIYTSTKKGPHSFPLRFMIKKSDGVIANTEYTARLRPKVLAVIAHGIDLNRFHPPPNQKGIWESYAKKRGLAGKRAIGQFGNIRPEKGSDLFVKVLCKVLPDFPDTVAIIAGRTSWRDRGYRRQLQKETIQAGIAKRVLWPGEIPYQELPELYQALDLCIACPRYEGFGLTPAEALSCGTPILVSDTGAFSSMVQEGKTGWVIPCNDSKGLEKQLRAFLETHGIAERMSEDCKKQSSRFFSAQREAQEIVEVYQGLWNE